MKKKSKFGMILLFIIILILCGFILKKSTQKAVYIEYTKIADSCNEILEINNNEVYIEQEFLVPYQKFYGLGLMIGTYGRENNSTYQMSIIDKTENKEIMSREFNTSKADDSKVYEIMLDSPIEVDTTHIFSVIIKAKTMVNGENGVAFYAESNKQLENNAKLFFNQEERNATLCMNIYGGEGNSFCFVFTLGCEIYALLLLGYIIYLYSNKKALKSNLIIQAGLVGIVVFVALFGFSKIETFADEADNIIGGMLINNGRIMYVDYYTQHTPFAYFLCSIFSMIGAQSVEQFRMLYYALISLIYAGLYIRHSKNFGNAKMALLPILQISFGFLLAQESVMILSDNIQAICMIALLLEFLQYLKDEKLDWKRSVIVSLSIFCSFGSAFVSLYAIFAIGLGVLINEIKYWREKSAFRFSKMIARYWKLVIVCALPFVVALGYFIITHSLVQFYKLAFQFNTEIYSGYLDDGFGQNIIQPFFIGISNFIQIIPNAVLTIVGNENVVLSIVELILGVNLIYVIGKMIHKKEYLKAVIAILFISFGFTRTSEPFHTVATWASIITVILFASDCDKINLKNRITLGLGIALIFTMGNYMNEYSANLFKKAEHITELDQKVISETAENEEIFLDVYSNSSVYLIYKNRLPINRLAFILPWYMDWYELDTIDDLTTKQPKVVVYDENLKAWEISGYDDYLRKYLHDNYDQVSNDGKMWINKQ